MKRPFSDISGLEASDSIQQMDISYSLPCLEDPESQVVVRVVFTLEKSGSIRREAPDLTRQDVIDLLRGLFERFRDTLRP